MTDKVLDPAPDPQATQSSWLKYPEPAALERIMPRTLMARVSLTIVVPLILVQVISTYVFYDNHWDTMSRRMAQDLAGDIASVTGAVVQFQNTEDRAWFAQNAKQTMELEVSFAPGARLERLDAVNEPEDLAIFRESLRGLLRQPFSIDRLTFRTDRLVAIRVQIDDGVLTLLAPRRRIFGSNSTYIFVIWMVGSSILLFGVATVYLRSQVAIVRRLGRAAENFGKGREVPDFPSDGPFEVRQAARAFNLMRARIQRQIAQRTEMLAGVSHDLRTPLTRLKLQLAMMEKTADVTDLRGDVAEMERMLEAYLAFARGDGAEEAAPANVAELIEDVVSRFSRDGAPVGLALTNLPKQMALKAVAFERCLGNLVGNAVRYGTHVEVQARRFDGVLQIDVDDDGPGIPEDKREEVFRAFHRLEPSRNPETGGVGLGLTITRDIARGMGGDVVLGDSPLGGLRATLTIPL